MSGSLFAVRATVEFHWGYSVKRPFFSASQPALAVPPPSALIGAIARAAAALSGWPEVTVESGGRAGSVKLYSSSVQVLDKVPWAALALTDERFLSPLIGLVETRDIVRVLIAPYQRRDNVYPGSALLFGVQPHGKVYAPSMRAQVLYLARSRDAASWGFALQSVGSKESIVSVSEVEVGEAKIRGPSGPVETRYYFPARLGAVREGSSTREFLSLPLKEHFLFGAAHGVEGVWEEFVVPLGAVVVEPSGSAAVVEDPWGGSLLVPKEVVGVA